VCPVTPDSLDMNDEENKLFWETPEYKGLTENTQVLSTCDPNAYDLVFFVGGFGVMFDFPFDENLATIAATVYERGGTVGAVCHGPIALLNVKLGDGSYLVKDKEVTAFCNEEEAIVGLLNTLPEHEGLGKSCEDTLLARGARFTKAEAFKANIACSDRLFTGQNPASAGPVADAIVASLSA
jgi:putative intracellular protease/amidase